MSVFQTPNGLFAGMAIQITITGFLRQHAIPTAVKLS